MINTQHLFTTSHQLDSNLIYTLIDKTQNIENNLDSYSQRAKGKILGLLFFEPSTRTYFSFTSAMQRLGGSVLGFANVDTTSISKGESLEDTARVMSAYVDIIAVRHAEVGSIKKIVDVTNIPIINAGEGDAEHPTQTLADLYTIFKAFKKLDVTIALYGDLKYGRTNHSLLLAGAKMGAKFICVAPEELQMPKEYLVQAESFGAKIVLTENLDPYLDQIQVLYVSRIQKERLSSGIDYEAVKKSFLVNQATLLKLPKNSIIMHPLPRVGEIEESVDRDSRAKYFEQAKNAVYMRMAILDALLP